MNLILYPQHKWYSDICSDNYDSTLIFRGPFLSVSDSTNTCFSPPHPRFRKRSSLASPRLVRWEAFPSCSLHVISLLCSSFSHLPFILTLISLVNEEPDQVEAANKMALVCSSTLVSFRKDCLAGE